MNGEAAVVRPLQRVDIGHGHVMALLPVGRQNYVMAPAPAFGRALRDAFRHGGDRLPPDTLSVNVFATLSPSLASLPPGVLYGGGWRTSTGAAPERITVRTGGRVHRAAQLRLLGRGDWGTYFVAVTGADLTEATITAYGPGGSVISEMELEPEPGCPDAAPTTLARP